MILGLFCFVFDGVNNPTFSMRSIKLKFSKNKSIFVLIIASLSASFYQGELDIFKFNYNCIFTFNTSIIKILTKIGITFITPINSSIKSLIQF